jgi:hypothetical protein
VAPIGRRSVRTRREPKRKRHDADAVAANPARRCSLTSRFPASTRSHPSSEIEKEMGAAEHFAQVPLSIALPHAAHATAIGVSPRRSIDKVTESCSLSTRTREACASHNETCAIGRPLHRTVG